MYPPQRSTSAAPLSAIVFAAVGAAAPAGAHEIRFRRFSLHCFLRWLLALFSALGAELCVWGHIFVLYFYVVPRF
jgi:hypothetical protein